jgi:hypothetical protein
MMQGKPSPAISSAMFAPPERAHDHATHTLAPEEPGEALALLLVAAQVHDRDIEALLVDALEDAGEHGALEVAEVGAHGVGRIDEPDHVARRLAHRGDIPHPVGDIDDLLLGLEVHLGVVVERPRHCGDRDAHLLGDFPYRRDEPPRSGPLIGPLADRLASSLGGGRRPNRCCPKQLQ